MISMPILTLVLLFIPRRAEAQSVTQPEDQVSVSEGFSVELKCTYSSPAGAYLYWYVQYPNQELQVLLRHTSQESNKGFQANLNKDEASYHLKKLHVQEEDAAVYFCALSTDSADYKRTFGKGTKLTVTPNIKDPQPALYQLTSPKSSDTSVCLLTDFDSSNTYTNGNDSTVLEMMTMESKSYGAVAWGSKSSFNCTNAFPQNIINLTQPSGSTCKVQDVEQSFETDKDLNLMNASLIFLRVIFLKTVGFNLLMTLRLWSN